MIKFGVLPFNVVVALFYIVFIALAFVVLKYSMHPLRRYRCKQKVRKEKGESQIDYNKAIAISVLKKYTLVGGFFCSDKKYLLKEFLFIGAYGVACLNINHIIIWPVGLSVLLFFITFILWDIVLKKVQEKVKESGENKINVEQKRGQSEIEIASQNVQPRIEVVNVDSIREAAKPKTTQSRNIVQILSVSGICIASAIMMLQTLMTLGNSVSNSGELNIISLLAIFAIDQCAVRICVCAALWTVCRVLREIAEKNSQGEESMFVALVCHQEITQFLIEQEKQRIRKEQEMVNSPPRKKALSPSRVPKALMSAQRQTYLNLINLQPTSRNGQQQNLEQIYLTTAQKDLSDAQNDNISGFYTKRHKNSRQNNEIRSFSGNKGTTIDVNDKKEHPDDLVILHENPFNQIENLPSDQFFIDSSGVRRTKRRGYNRKKNKRNLKLTGNSPYLEYLPDMLKKVDQFKNINTSKDKDYSKKML